MPRVVVVPYDSAWPAAFEAAAKELIVALGEQLLAVHHIGSTSIPGTDAKPIIDMLLIVSDLSALDAHTDRMTALGYEAKGEFGIAGRRYFRRNNSAGDRTHHIHAFSEGSPHILRHLAFRDYLRAHPPIARQYSDLKRRLAAECAGDIERYMDGKGPFIVETQEAALEWIRAG